MIDVPITFLLECVCVCVICASNKILINHKIIRVFFVHKTGRSRTLYHIMDCDNFGSVSSTIQISLKISFARAHSINPTAWTWTAISSATHRWNGCKSTICSVRDLLILFSSLSAGRLFSIKYTFRIHWHQLTENDIKNTFLFE